MKIYIFIVTVLLLCLLAFPVAADGPLDLGADMVKNGFIAFVRAMGDESYAAAGVNGSQSSVDAYVELSTFSFDPFIFPRVRELNFISGVIAFLYILLYLGMGMAWAIVCRVWPNLAMTIAEITDLDQDIAGKQYLQNIGICIFALLLGHTAIKLILTFNMVLSSLISKYSHISTIDAGSNFLLYFISGIVFLFNMLFFCWRLVVICGVASFSLVIGALLIWGFTRSIALSVLKYFTKIVFLQLIIVAVIACAMIAIDVVRFFMIFLPGNVAANSLPLFIMIATLLMTLWVSFKICIPNSNIINIIVFRNALRRR